MATTDTKAVQAKERLEGRSTAEYTRPGLTFKPAVDIFETDKALTLVADMPGVKAEDLSIDLRDSVLTLSGEVQNPEGPGESEVMREYRTGSYFRQFTLSEVVDQAGVEAHLENGVLRLILPKVEPAKPRKIEVKVE